MYHGNKQKKSKKLLLHFLHFINKGKYFCYLNLDLENPVFKPYHQGLIASSWIKSDITLFIQLWQLTIFNVTLILALGLRVLSSKREGGIWPPSLAFPDSSIYLVLLCLCFHLQKNFPRILLFLPVPFFVLLLNLLFHLFNF